jgi:ribosomal protein S18 acetylase RimI-like enzyme
MADGGARDAPDGAATADGRRFPTAAPVIPGLVLRHLRAPDDYHDMNTIANAIRAADGEDFFTSDEQFQLFYDNLDGSDARQDVAIAEMDGRIVGYGRAGCHQELDGPRIYEVVPFVDPNVAGEGVFLAMVDAVETRLRTIAAGHPPGEKVFETFGGDKAPEREALLLRLGYAAVRWSFAMVRPSVDDLPDAPLPAGLEIRDVRAEDLPHIWAADQEAFRDHWGFTPATDAEYQRFLTDPVTSDSTLWRVAWEGDQICGQVRSFINPTENERWGRLRGYVEFISVRRPWRGRGLARALIAASFPLLRARGMQEAGLGVDTENTSGALRVYEGCGFRPVSRSTSYRKPLA